MNKKGFFFSLLALIIIVFFFVFFKSVIEKSANDAEIDVEKTKFLQYNEFVDDLSKNYLPSQMRMMVKKALVNMSFNGSLRMDNLTLNLTTALMTGNLSNSVVVLGNYSIFNASMERLHDIWSFMNEYSYTIDSLDLSQTDWQNMTANYSIRMMLSAPDLDFKTTLHGEIGMTVFGINISEGIIQPKWVENHTNPCVLRELSPTYDCHGVNGIMHN